MDSDSYQVKILHYINPYLIWVEVKTLSDTRTFGFEQIGIYGILPLQPLTKVETNKSKFQRCVEWDPATSIMMQKVLDGATEVWFVPIYTYRRTSIFESNLHKFGDILIKKPDGKLTKLLWYLTDSNFAIENSTLFHQQLSLGNIKTELDNIKTNEVIRELEKFYKYNANHTKGIDEQHGHTHSHFGTEIGIKKRNILKMHLKTHYNVEKDKTKDLYETLNAHTNTCDMKILSPKINTATVNCISNNNHLGKTSRMQEVLKIYYSKKTSDSNKDHSCGSIKNVEMEKDSEDRNVEEIIQEKYPTEILLKDKESREIIVNHSKSTKDFVNPFRNMNLSYSDVIDKHTTPVLMVHTKNNNMIVPHLQLKEITFNKHIERALRDMSVQSPKMLQSISWWTILRGYSLFMISPPGSGKTFGYLPAVCSHVYDVVSDLHRKLPACIILCPTAKSVSNIEHLCKVFLGAEKSVMALYAGVDNLKLTMFQQNGCDILVCTPPFLFCLMYLTDFEVNFRHLSIVVFDDCERLALVYADELKVILFKIKEMLKHRSDKVWKVQYIVASRVWCDFMKPLARKAPNTVICIDAFQECVLYSKATTQVSLVKKNDKIDVVLNFLKNTDISKKTVIICRFDDEVTVLENVLLKKNFIVLACNTNATVEELCKINRDWNEHRTLLTGPILVCCDGNLNHLDVTDAHYLIHFSLPHLFSMFCRRFSVLNDNYASIFKPDKENVEVKILLEEDNIEQLPKILNFIKRCTNDVPPVLDEICKTVLVEKNAAKAKFLVPICGSLLTLGECPDFMYCQERHAVFKEYDDTKDWMPKNGVITFTILHYHSAVSYSAKLLTNIVNGSTKHYSQNYEELSIRMGLYYGNVHNRKRHDTPKVGDICAVLMREHFFFRCQVMKVINRYQNGNPNELLIKLLDEEKLDTTKDIYLYHLPKELESIQTYAIQVQLANVQPKDKDVTFSNFAREQLQKTIESENNLYLQGKVVMSVGKCVFIDTLEGCVDIKHVNKPLVRFDFKRELFGAHALLNREHIPKLLKLCKDLEACRDLNAKYESRRSSDVIQAAEMDETCGDILDNEKKLQQCLRLDDVKSGMQVDDSKTKI